MNTPVLLLTFNRPNLVRRQLQQLRAIQPPRLYVSSDGPRATRPADRAQVEECRELVRRGVEWPCTVLHKFEPENLGCGLGVSSAISWFFEHETEGVILEDDCLLDPSFFVYCEQLLDRYRGDTRVGGICADFKFLTCDRPASHYSWTHFPQVWGWATWRRVWRDYDFRLAGWDGQVPMPLGRAPLPRAARAYWAANFSKVARGELDTWDFQLSHLALSRGYRFIHPMRNLVTNIGFGPDATHTRFRADATANLPTYPLAFPLVESFDDSAYDDFLATEYFVARPFLRKVLNRLRAVMGNAR